MAGLNTPFPLVTVEGGHDLRIPGVCVDQDLGARQDFAAVGQASIKLLVSRIASGSGADRDDERVVIEPDLIVRGSTV